MNILKLKFGALSISGDALASPKKPWGYKGDYAPSYGDIPKYEGGDIELVDSTRDDELISWVPIVREGKQLLIADRNILANVSWDQLNDQGLIFGKKIKLDGKTFNLRVLSGGEQPFEDDYELGGFPVENEWDSFVVNGSSPGLPVAKESDFNEYVTEESFTGEHNQFWNWAYTYSWCQEVRKDYVAPRVLRGYYSARTFHSNPSSGRDATIGWRPVLEILESDGSDFNIEEYIKKRSDEDLRSLFYSIEDELIERLASERAAEIMEDKLSQLLESMKTDLKGGKTDAD